eukprot:3491447-Rhodomonas_salina.2
MARALRFLSMCVASEMGPGTWSEEQSRLRNQGCAVPFNTLRLSACRASAVQCSNTHHPALRNKQMKLSLTTTSETGSPRLMACWQP